MTRRSTRLSLSLAIVKLAEFPAPDGRPDISASRVSFFEPHDGIGQPRPHLRAPSGSAARPPAGAFGEMHTKRLHGTAERRSVRRTRSLESEPAGLPSESGGARTPRCALRRIHWAILPARLENYPSGSISCQGDGRG